MEPDNFYAGANVGRPSGTSIVMHVYPALKRGANLDRASGAGFGVGLGASLLAWHISIAS